MNARIYDRFSGVCKTELHSDPERDNTRARLELGLVKLAESRESSGVVGDALRASDAGLEQMELPGAQSVHGRNGEAESTSYSPGGEAMRAIKQVGAFVWYDAIPVLVLAIWLAWLMYQFNMPILPQLLGLGPL